MGAIRLLAFACAAATAGAAAQVRQTEHCNAHVLNSVIVEAKSFDARDRLASVGPADPDLSQRLWTPISAAPFGSLTPYVSLYYRESEDIGEIAAAIRADPGLQALVAGASPNGVSCFLPPPRTLYDVHEFHNEVTNHYFLVANAAEKRLIENGSAGPGWKPTGTVFKVDDLMYGDCSPRGRVYRFYTFGANSHVFTPDPQECGGLRKPGTGWIYEGVAFAATRPEAGRCDSASPTPVYRFYNNRWMQNDSNHRFVIAPAVRSEMKAKGWIEEGIAFCLPPQG
jgi:hypothetical protein